MANKGLLYTSLYTNALGTKATLLYGLKVIFLSSSNPRTLVRSTTGVCLWTSPFPYISVNNITEYAQSVFFVYIYDIYAVTDDKADKSLCEILETPEIIVEK